MFFQFTSTSVPCKDMCILLTFVAVAVVDQPLRLVKLISWAIHPGPLLLLGPNKAFIVNSPMAMSTVRYQLSFLDCHLHAFPCASNGPWALSDFVWSVLSIQIRSFSFSLRKGTPFYSSFSIYPSSSLFLSLKGERKFHVLSHSKNTVRPC